MVTDELAVPGEGDEDPTDRESEVVDMTGDVPGIPWLKAAMARRSALGRLFRDAPRDGAALPLPAELGAYGRGEAGRDVWRIQTYEAWAAHRRFVEKVLAVGYVVRPVALASIGLLLVRLLS